MATKYCLNCEGEFLASVQECPDCELPLVDERPAQVLDEADSADGQVEYDIADWATESRVMLEQLLGADAIPRAWQAANLLVPAAFERRVDALVSQVEVTTLPTLDPDADKVAYDVDDWSDEQQTELMAKLEEVGVSYEVDIEGALVIEARDEDRVEAMLDTIDFPDALPIDDPGGLGDPDDPGEEAGDEHPKEEQLDEGLDLDGVDAMAVLSDLFVSADKLKRKATDADGVLQLIDTAATVGQMRLPYGFSRAVWDDIVAQAAGLRSMIEDNRSEDDAIEEHARALRDCLRPYL